MHTPPQAASAASPRAAANAWRQPPSTSSEVRTSSQPSSRAAAATTAAGTPIYDYVDRNNDGEEEQDNFMLTNSGESPVSHVISLVLQKEFDFGLDLLLGYAYTQAEDVSPMTSSVAASAPLSSSTDPVLIVVRAGCRSSPATRS